MALEESTYFSTRQTINDKGLTLTIYLSIASYLCKKYALGICSQNPQRRAPVRGECIEKERRKFFLFLYLVCFIRTFTPEIGILWLQNKKNLAMFTF